LLSFEEFFAISEVEKNIWIVVYDTVDCTTHSITWDSCNKKILDPDTVNNSVFSYESIASFQCEDICERLQTIFEKPCILYTAFWRRKSPHNWKKKKLRASE
jgi:hypothetical protein